MTIFFVIVALIFAGAGALYWRWNRTVREDVAEGADFEWKRYQRDEPELIAGMSEERFREVYAYVHTPRFPAYALGAAATFFAALPVIFGLLAGGLWVAQAVGATPEPIEVADRLLLDGDELRFFKDTPPEAALYYLHDLSGFYYFFGVLLTWLAVFAFFMHRFHSRRPGYFRDELVRARG